VNGLALRVASALVLAPVVLAALYLGGLATELLILLAGGAMAYEWTRLAVGVQARAAVAVGTAAVAAAIALMAVGAPWPGALCLLAGAPAAAVLAVGQPPQARLWLGAGVVYLGAACLGFLYLRDRPEVGLLLIGWLIAVVWVTDTAAYAAGKALGGPKLAPRISPMKTWAGLLGGIAGAALVSALLALWQDELAGATALPGPAGVALAGALLALVEQAGDLLESHLKRRVGAKDASALIPGHGGVLDRADGLVAASLVLALLMSLLNATT
jgi:phosphatidate cytidylyltransferase